MAKILRLPKVKEATGLSRSSIYSLMQQKLFPMNIALSPRTVGWLESDIMDWIGSRVRKNNGGIKNA